MAHKHCLGGRFGTRKRFGCWPWESVSFCRSHDNHCVIITVYPYNMLVVLITIYTILYINASMFYYIIAVGIIIYHASHAAFYVVLYASELQYTQWHLHLAGIKVNYCVSIR